jgi:quinol monooxygenase YgiN
VLLPHGGAKDIVYLYEIYDDDAAFAAHQASPHYKNFKETTGVIVANMDVVRMSM